MIIQSISQITSSSRPKYLIVLDIALDNLLHYIKSKRESLEINTIKSVLLVTYILAAGLLCRLFRVNVTIHKELFNLKPDRYLLVANHHRAVDPCLILATLPFNSFKTLLPIRLFTANVYLQRWWQKTFLRAFGSFKAYSVENELSGVRGGIYLSDKRQALLIFPEGKRIIAGSYADPHIGIAYLTQHRDFTVLPIYIEYTNDRTRINWGKPFKINDKMKSQDLNALAKLLFDRVLELSG